MRGLGSKVGCCVGEVDGVVIGAVDGEGKGEELESGNTLNSTVRVLAVLLSASLTST